MTALILLEIGRCLKKPLAGISAGLLYAISPHGLFWSLTIMSETLFAFMLSLSLLLWTRYILSDRIRWLYLCGGILGLSAWVRPIGIYLVLIWTVYTIIVLMKASGLRNALGRASVLLIGAVLVVTPWMARNWVSYQRLEFAGVSSRTFYTFNLAQVIASGEGISRSEATHYIESETNLIRETFRVVIRYPKAFFQQQAAGTLRVLFDIESGVWAQLLGMGEFQGRSFGIYGLLAQGQIGQGLSRAWHLLVDSNSSPLLILGILSILYTLLLYLLAAAIVLKHGSQTTAWVVVLTLLTLGNLFLTPGAAGQARFRIPGEPLLAMLAGLGIVALRMRFVGNQNYAGERVEIDGV
jgi:4-amino-4-deoxy-L-arabinose transferase-like glycosyltransferase